MIKYIKSIDTYGKNIILVFLGASLVNFFNLLYQLLIAHRLAPADFAAFNSLLSILMLFSVPLGTLQIAVAKYSAEFSAQNQIKKIQVLLSSLLRKTLVLAIFTVIIFYFASFYIIDKLKISSVASGYILAISLALSCIVPVLSGGLQGLELFKWLMSISVITGALKLALAFIFIRLGFNIAGALGAFLAASLVSIIISFFPLRNFISLRIIKDSIDFKEIFLYLFPVAITSFCFIALVSFDMVLVKYFFLPEDSGLYSLAQMVGKIFLFLPGAISMVMFPKIAGLNAKNMDTASTLKRSLFYATILCVIACLVYNIFPSFILKILTGKIFFESIILGRLFSVSMSFFAILYILIAYFLSIKDLRFIKYLVLFTLLQFLAIVFFHKSLIQVQSILCINAILLFFIHLWLAHNRKGLIPKQGTVPNVE
jgi:O-antigen/teichoic acid export membrane protein